LALIGETELFKPSCGFPEISYRWTKTDLALVLTAMSRYGDDFATIARTIGSKTEGFIRDFYNQCRELFPLDDIIRHAKGIDLTSPDVDEKLVITSIQDTPLLINTEIGPEVNAVSVESSTQSLSSPSSSHKPLLHVPLDSHVAMKPEENETPLASTECSQASQEVNDISMLTDDETGDQRRKSNSVNSEHLSDFASIFQSEPKRGASTRGRPRGRPRGRGRVRPS
uniref:SANT domain-containing protein n=1 Tax=Echinostoma caproni TaxID=27848 RepID=A0A182ZZB3_9TREM